MPRSGAVAPPHGLGLEAGIVLPFVGYDWNRSNAVSKDGHNHAIPFYTDLHVGARFALLDRCELGGHTISLMRWMGEVRCGILQERSGHPLSIALSGALGFDISAFAMRGPLSDPNYVPNARIGIDVSVTAAKLLTPILDVYLTTGSEVRPALQGATPTDSTQTMVRKEVRVVIPFGLGFDINRDEEGNVARLVLGASPFFVLAPGPSTIVSDSGVAATVGLEFVGTTFPK